MKIDLGSLLGSLVQLKPLILLAGKQVLKNAMDQAEKELAELEPAEVERAKQKIIDKFDHNRNIPGSIRKTLKRFIQKLEVQDIYELIDKVDEKIDEIRW